MWSLLFRAAVAAGTALAVSQLGCAAPITGLENEPDDLPPEPKPCNSDAFKLESPDRIGMLPCDLNQPIRASVFHSNLLYSGCTAGGPHSYLEIMPSRSSIETQNHLLADSANTPLFLSGPIQEISNTHLVTETGSFEGNPEPVNPRSIFEVYDRQGRLAHRIPVEKITLPPDTVNSRGEIITEMTPIRASSIVVDPQRSLLYASFLNVICSSQECPNEGQYLEPGIVLIFRIQENGNLAQDNRFIMTSGKIPMKVLIAGSNRDRLVVVSADSTVEVFSLETLEKLSASRLSGMLGSPALFNTPILFQSIRVPAAVSPDGKNVLFASQLNSAPSPGIYRLEQLDADTQTLRLITDYPSMQYRLTDRNADRISDLPIIDMGINPSGEIYMNHPINITNTVTLDNGEICRGKIISYLPQPCISLEGTSVSPVVVVNTAITACSLWGSGAVWQSGSYFGNQRFDFYRYP